MRFINSPVAEQEDELANSSKRLESKVKCLGADTVRSGSGSRLRLAAHGNAGLKSVRPETR